MHRMSSYSVLRKTIERRLREQEATREPRQDPAITITRSTGSGALAIADQLAGYLSNRDSIPGVWTVLDRELVQRVREDHQIPARIESFFPEDRVGGLDSVIGELLGAHPPLSTMLRQTTETVRRLCRMGRVIIVGRGANLMAAGMPNVLHVRLVGSLARRRDRVMRELGMGQKEAEVYIGEVDEARAAYVRQHFGRSVGDPLYYHLVINTDGFDDDEVVRMIGGVVARASTMAAATASG